YAKGTLVALGLDVLIRENSNGAASLDTLMRRLWQSYGEPDVGIAEGEIEQLVAEICNTDVSGFFQNYVYGVTELPLDEWLATLGIGLSYRAAKGSNDNGGLRKQAEESLPRCSMGVRYKVIGDYLSLVSVSDEGAAQVAGLSAGDRLVAIDGLQVKAAMLDDGFPGKKPGELVAVTAFRRDELMQFSVQLARAAEDTCDLFLQQQDDENLQSQAWRANWSAGL
ncbi:MAG: PDZ domain-containing protein, partial [bacterium]